MRQARSLKEKGWRSSLAGGVQHIDLPKPRNGATVADGVRLRRFAFAIIFRAVQFVGVGAAETVAGAPEVGGARLVGDVAQHFTEFAILDFPKGLAAELEVVTLLVNGPATVAKNGDSVFNFRGKVLERNVFLSRFERNIWHARERHA